MTSFTANGLTVIADEEYLTITTTVPSLPSSSAAFSSELPPPPALSLSLLSTPPSYQQATQAESPVEPPAQVSAPSASNNGWDDDDEEDDEDPRRVKSDCIWLFIVLSYIALRPGGQNSHRTAAQACQIFICCKSRIFRSPLKRRFGRLCSICSTCCNISITKNSKTC